MTKLIFKEDHRTWSSEAKCKGSTNLMYPKVGNIQRIPGESDKHFEARQKANETVLLEEAAKFCKGIYDGRLCPVMAECLNYGISINDSEGVYGGETPKARRRIKRSRAKKMQRISAKLLNWATDVDPGAIQQALKTSRLPIVEGHVALMSDAHVGIGATVGSVIPTKDSVIPSAVGVDIGCGMIAVETDLFLSDMPDALDHFTDDLEGIIPAVVGKGHDYASAAAATWFNKNHSRFSPKLTTDLGSKALKQFGTLGSGNHFFEICKDETERIWIVLHSGSRAVGNKLAQAHIKVAKRLAGEAHLKLEDPDLAWLQADTPEFDDYIDDMLACQDYAMQNRSTMMNNALRAFFILVGKGREMRRINCHHNFTQQEMHADNKIWVTRKGAIKADKGDLGIIPGSMGTSTFIIEGLGNPLSYNSCSHGSGRRFSRGEAKRRFNEDDLAKAMQGIIWQADKARFLIDEIPAGYKDIIQTMADQEDLVKVKHTLKQILNYKGN